MSAGREAFDRGRPQRLHRVPRFTPCSSSCRLFILPIWKGCLVLLLWRAPPPLAHLRRRVVAQMGVPGLQTWLKRRYPEAFVPLPQGMAFDHVYIDMQSTLHQIIRRGDKPRHRAGGRHAAAVMDWRQAAGGIRQGLGDEIS